MHVLVTGASGFVGGAVTRLLLASGHTVSTLGRRQTGDAVGTHQLVHDLGSGPITLPEGIDGVVHLAQSRAYRAFPGDVPEMFAVNVAGTHELLMAASQSNVRSFCFISTGTVYEPFTGQPLREDQPLAPMSFLGASKLAAEILSRPFGSFFQLSILRLFGPYGPGQYGRLVPDLLRRVRTGEAVRLPAGSDGMEFAPTYVDDIAVVIAAALQERWTGIYNVGAPERVSIRGAALLIGKALKREPRFEVSEGVSAPSIIPDLQRLSSCFDTARFRSFETGISDLLLAEASPLV